MLERDDTQLISDERGDITIDGRLDVGGASILCSYRLRIDGHALVLVQAAEERRDGARYVLARANADRTVLVTRERTLVPHGFRDDVVVQNRADSVAVLKLAFLFGARVEPTSSCGPAEVDRDVRHHGYATTTTLHDGLIAQQAIVFFSAAPTLRGPEASFPLKLPAGTCWQVSVEVRASDADGGH